MKINYYVSRWDSDINEGPVVHEKGSITMKYDVELDPHVVKLIDYLTEKLCKNKFSAVFDDNRTLVDAVCIDSEAILKWIAKLPEWAAFKLKVSNPLTLRVFRKDIEEKYRAFLKKYKVPEDLFIRTESEYDEMVKKSIERRKNKK